MTSSNKDNAVAFEGEEAGAGYASPSLDLAAACFLVLLSIIVIIASWRLPVPGDLLTAPGLLPFFTAASLLVMAVILGGTALNRKTSAHGLAQEIASADKAQIKRTLLLIVLVGLYILALQYLAFQYDFSVGGQFFSVSAFEPVTVTILAAIICIYWGGPLWITTLVSVVWTLLLSLVFQKAFNLPLPGSF